MQCGCCGAFCHLQDIKIFLVWLTESVCSLYTYNAYCQTLTNCFQSLFEILEVHYELGTFITFELHNQLVNSVADPELELRGRGGGVGGGGFDLYLPCWLFSLLSFFLFLPKVRGPGTPWPLP